MSAHPLHKYFISYGTIAYIFFSDSLNIEEEENTSDSNETANENNETETGSNPDDDLETASNPDEEVEIPDVDEDAQTEEKSKHTEL